LFIVIPQSHTYQTDILGIGIKAMLPASRPMLPASAFRQLSSQFGTGA
jgi:hypothetical protein